MAHFMENDHRRDQEQDLVAGENIITEDKIKGKTDDGAQPYIGAGFLLFKFGRVDADALRL